jgi:membrane-bound lytic murein transglycosylase MltF
MIHCLQSFRVARTFGRPETAGGLAGDIRPTGKRDIGRSGPNPGPTGLRNQAASTGMKRCAFGIVIGLFAALLACAYAVAGDSDDKEALLEHLSEPSTGDLDVIIKRGFVRVLTTYNPLYFDYMGFEQHGLAVEIARAFEAHLRKTLGKHAHSLHVVLIPVPRNELLTKLAAGLGDIAAANLTVTPTREELVDFADPMYPDVHELIITGPGAPEITSFDDLAGTEAHVRPSSSYFEHLSALNRSRKKEGRPEIPVRPADERLEDYDLLDMVDKGVVPAVVVDSHTAALWVQVFANIRVHENLVIHSGGAIAWAVRKNNPELLGVMNGFVRTARKGTLLGNTLLKRYLDKTVWMENVVSGSSREKYQDTIEIIKRHSKAYDFDWLMIAAQGYQESGLDQNKRSPSGAIGVMQILPGTAADTNVAISNIQDTENNVHAGVKYLRFLRDRYFSDAGIEPLDGVLLSLAAYNAGPHNIVRARKQAASTGFDPNQWFGHVEVAAARTIGREPVTYVCNIYKYYVVYRHLEELRQQREVLLKE